jgi:hypothetical protein
MNETSKSEMGAHKAERKVIDYENGDVTKPVYAPESNALRENHDKVFLGADGIWYDLDTRLPAYTMERNASREALIEELLVAVLELRKAWIAPHRFSVSKAELNVARLSDEIQQLEG